MADTYHAEPRLKIVLRENTLSAIWICRRDCAEAQRALGEYLEVLGNLDMTVELVIVNRGLPGPTVERMLAQAREVVQSVKLLQSNGLLPLGDQILNAFRICSGGIVALLPGYVQSDPHDLRAMVALLDEDLDYVASWRVRRVDSAFHQWQSRVFNAVVRRLTRLALHDINSQLRVMRRKVLETVPLSGNLDVFLPVLAARQGFRVGEMEVRHVSERRGESERLGGTYLRRVLDLLTLFFLVRFTQRPFRFFGSIGAVLGLAGSAVLATLGIERLWGDPLADRPLLVLGSLLIVVGVQTFTLGLLGELIIFVKAGGLGDKPQEEWYENEERSDVSSQQSIG